MAVQAIASISSGDGAEVAAEASAVTVAMTDSNMAVSVAATSGDGVEVAAGASAVTAAMTDSNMAVSVAAISGVGVGVSVGGNSSMPAVKAGVIRAAVSVAGRGRGDGVAVETAAVGVIDRAGGGVSDRVGVG